MERAVVWLVGLLVVVWLLFFGLAHGDLLTPVMVGAACYWLWRRFGHG